MRAPFLIPFLSLASGIAFSRLLFANQMETAAAFGASATVCLAAWRWTPRLMPLALWAGCLWLGAVTETWHREVPPPGIDAGPSETVVAEGCVVESTAWSADRAVFVLELEPGARARVSVYPRRDETPPSLRYGERVEMEGRFRTPRNFENPGGLDYAGLLARRRIYWQASVSGAGRVKRLPGACGSPARAWLASMRERSLAAIDREFPPDSYTNAVLRAALLGDPSRLRPAWSDEFRRTGTYHVLVISGLHLTMISAAVIAVLRLLPLPLGARCLVAILTAWFYAMLAGGAAPVIRAASGTTLFLAASYVFRPSGLLNPLAVTGFFFLLADPLQLWEPGFHLSFLAVGTIAVLARPVLDERVRVYAFREHDFTRKSVDWRRPPGARKLLIELRLLARAAALAGLPGASRIPAVTQWVAAPVCRVAEALLFTLILQVGLMLPMVAYFHRAPLSALAANLVVTPLMMWALPVAFFALVTGWPPLVRATETLVSAAHGAAQWLAAWDAAPRVPDPPAWLALALLASLAVSGYAFYLGRRWRLAPALAVAALLTLLLAHPFPPEFARGELELTAIDVGQGDSLFVVSPEGRTLLVDGGGFPVIDVRRTRLDTGENVVSPYLWSRGFRHLDAAAVTHPDQDHIGGLEAILENFRPRELWIGAEPDHEGLRRLLERARGLGVRVVRRRAGERFGWGGAAIEVLAPGDAHPGARPSNNDSLVLRAVYHERSFLLTGDVERAGEYRLLSSGGPLRADVLKVAHHGSRTSSAEDFLDAVNPIYAVVSAGKDNSYRHPHPAVVERLTERGVRVLRTDEHGRITLRTDGHRIAAETQLWPVRAEGWFPRRQPY